MPALCRWRIASADSSHSRLHAEFASLSMCLTAARCAPTSHSLTANAGVVACQNATFRTNAGLVEQRFGFVGLVGLRRVFLIRRLHGWILLGLRHGREPLHVAVDDELGDVREADL